jgi:hemoglobin
MDDTILYELIGEDGFVRLVAAFYRQVPDDDILGKMYPAEDLHAAEERLRDFLIGRFGGPQRYVERRGHPRLRARHMPFRIDQAARDRWMALMDKALAETKLPAEAEQLLREFLSQTATFMINHA